MEENNNRVDEILFQHHFGNLLGRSLFVVITPNTAVVALILIGLNTVFNLVVLISLYISWCVTVKSV